MWLDFWKIWAKVMVFLPNLVKLRQIWEKLRQNLEKIEANSGKRV